jgi:hypothetical protein
VIISYWLESLQRFNEGVLIVASVALAATMIAMTAIVARAWRRVRQTDARSGLAALMLQRGMPASDIERILMACSQSVEKAVDAETHIIELMKENDYSGDDVERVLDAARKNGTIEAATLKLIESLVEQGVEGREIENLLDARAPRAPQVAHR